MALHEFYWRNEAWLIEDVVNKRHLSKKKYLLILEFTVSAYHLHRIFGWDFWDKWNSLFLPVKTGQYKNDPVELGRLERLVPGLQSRRPCVREWHEWDFCKWYSLSRSFRLKRKKRNTVEGILPFRKIFTELNRSIWHFIRTNRFFGINGKRPVVIHHFRNLSESCRILLVKFQYGVKLGCFRSNFSNVCLML